MSFEPFSDDDYAGFEGSSIDNTLFGRLNAFFDYILFCGGQKKKPVKTEAEDIPKTNHYIHGLSDATTESADVNEGTMPKASIGSVPLLTSSDIDEKPIFHSIDDILHFGDV